MNIAICLAGQPRFFQDSYDLSAPNLYSSEHSFDFFLHAWHDPASEGGFYRSSYGEAGGIITPETERKLVDLYSPLRYRFDKQIQFDTSGFHMSGDYNCPFLFSNFSWPYSIRQVGHLCEEVCAERKKQYDLVLCMRYDLHIMDAMPWDDIYRTGALHTLDTGLGLTFALCDQLFIGSMEQMKYIFNLYFYQFHYFYTRETFNTERNAFNLVIEKGIPTKLLDLQYKILGR